MVDPMDVPLHDSLDGQVALVTGATRGIGEQIAARLTEHGAIVYAGARDTGDVDREDQRSIELDVTEDAQIQAAAERIADDAGRLDVLVNNAGVFGPSDPLGEVSVEEIDRVLETNLRGPMILSHELADLLLAEPGSRVVNVSSGLGSFSEGMSGTRTPYCVTKAGLNALTACLHDAYHEEGLIVNSCCPGWVATDMGGPNAPRSPSKGAKTPAWLARFAEGAPSGRFWRDREPIAW